MSGPIDAEESSPGLFFASSDEEQEEEDVEMTDEAALPSTTTASDLEEPEALFLPSTEDEDEYFQGFDAHTPSPTKKRRSSVATEGPSEDYDVPRASSVSSASDHISISSSSPEPENQRRMPPTKKRKIFPPPPAPSPKPHTAEVVDPSPSSVSPPQASFYIGELVIRAYSNTAGKGYIKLGDEVVLKRDENSEELGPSKDPKGKGKAKQATITNMFKAAPPKPTKKKKDSNVRLFNSRGFGEICVIWSSAQCSHQTKEFGRLPQETCVWAAPLLDLGMYILEWISPFQTD